MLIKLNDCVVESDTYLLSSEQLSSIPTLPAQSYKYKEIRANEEGDAVSGNSWLDATGSGEVIMAYYGHEHGRFDNMSFFLEL